MQNEMENSTSIKLEESTTIQVEELIITDVLNVKSEPIEIDGHSCEPIPTTTSSDNTPVVKQESAAIDIIDEVTETVSAATAAEHDKADSFSNSHALEAHPPTASVKHISGICGASYKLRSGLHNHKEIHTSTSVEPKPLKCDLCDKEYLRMSLFKRHLKIHSSVRSYKCDICGIVGGPGA